MNDAWSRAASLRTALAPHAAIASILGKRLTGLCHGELEIEDPLGSDDLGPLELSFDDGSSLQARLVSDGESATFAVYASAPALLYAQNCHWRRVDLGARPRLHDLLGTQVVAIDALVFAAAGTPQLSVAGYVFRFQHGRYLSYHNGGDSARIYLDALPLQPGPPFELTAEPIAALP